MESNPFLLSDANMIASCSHLALYLPMGVAFLHLRKVHDRWEVQGIPDGRLGHQVPTRQGCKPDGIFVRWVWTGSFLRVSNDRYGFYPLFHCARANEIMLSPSIPRLLELGAPTELDEAGLAVFLRLGFFIGEDTPFRSIRALPPDTDFEWRPGVLRVEGRRPLAKPARISPSDAVETYASLFRVAMRRRTPPDGNFAVPLSGGRDSRHILLELCEAMCRPKYCVTVRHFPPRNNSDVECASQLATALGLDHVIVDQPQSEFQVELRKNLRTSFCTDEHPHYMALSDHVRGRIHTLYDGIGGDNLSQSIFLNPELVRLFEDGRFGELASKLLGTDRLLKHLLTQEALRKYSYELAHSHLVAELRQHADAPNPIGSFYFWNRTRREIALAPYCILDEVPTVFSPFLDHDLYDFLSSLTPRMLLEGQFHTKTIQVTYPRYADIPYENKSPKVDARGHFRRYARELAGYVLARRSTAFIRQSYLLPRLFRCLVDGRYSSAVSWLAPKTIFLLQLERLTNPD